MSFADENLIPLSALQHYLYCPRQCALIHIDGLWAENRLTAEGAVLHRRVDTPGSRARRPRGDDAASEGVRVVRAMPLLHRTLGLTGKADTVEFPIDKAGLPAGPPRPVEHKRGRPKRHDADRVQLCAQALCLEDMTGLEICEGDLFYHEVHRRERVLFDATLRDRTIFCVTEIRGLIVANLTPAAEYGPKCRNCSLRDLCLPKGTGPRRDPSRYLARSLALSLDAGEPE